MKTHKLLKINIKNKYLINITKIYNNGHKLKNINRYCYKKNIINKFKH